MGLLLPARVATEIQREKWREQRAQYRALVAELFDFDDPVCREWNPLLAEVDPALRMGKGKPGATPLTGVPVRAHFYHWVRENDTAAPTVQAITGEDGESFAMPSSRVLEDLRRSDLQNPAIFRALLERRARIERQAEEAKVAERAERQGELMERWNAVSRTQVSMNTDTPWAQNFKGYSKVRGEKRD